MASQRGAGKLRSLLAFQRRGEVEDDYGNVQVGKWGTAFTAHAELIPLRGGEAVMASRLDGRQPYVIRIRSSSQSRAVDASWQIVDARNESRVFAIKAIVDPDNKNAWLDITATLGEAS